MFSMRDFLVLFSDSLNSAISVILDLPFLLWISSFLLVVVIKIIVEAVQVSEVNRRRLEHEKHVKQAMHKPEGEKEK